MIRARSGLLLGGAVLTVCVALLANAAPAAAQPVRDGSAGGRGVGPFVPPGHWTFRAAARLHALGLTPDDFDPGVRARSVSEIRAILAGARPRAGDRTGLQALVRSFESRLAGEYALADAPVEPGEVLHRVAITVGHHEESGQVLGGVGFLDGDWTGARPLPEVDTPEARIGAAISNGRFMAGGEFAVRRDSIVIAEAYAGLRLGILGFWAGRRALGYGPGASGGMVLDGGHVFTGAGAQLNRGYVLPGFLRVLGPVRFEGFLTRVDNVHMPPGQPDTSLRPYFGAVRIAGSPGSRRVTLGASRAAMFGGEGNAPVTLGNLLTMLYGNHAGEMGEFHQELFAVDASWRPPVGPLPLLLRLEWGMADASGMYHRAPGVIWAVELGAVPGASPLSVGFERTLFTGCLGCRNTLWYRNWSFREGWTDGGRLLGHPLGGHGREHMFYASLAATRMLHVDADVRWRQRRSENLLSPDRLGGSTALGIRIDVRPTAATHIGLGGSYERGATGWNTSFVSAGVGARF